MEEKGISCERSTVYIRLNAYAAMSNINGMERLLTQMEGDPQFTMDWNAYVIVANGYLKAGLFEKSLEMLKKLEQHILACGVYLKETGDMEVAEEYTRRVRICSSQLERVDTKIILENKGSVYPIRVVEDCSCGNGAYINYCNPNDKPSWKDSVGNSNGEEQSVAFGHGKMGEDEDVAGIEAEVEAQDDVETNERINAGKEAVQDSREACVKRYIVEWETRNERSKVGSDRLIRSLEETELRKPNINLEVVLEAAQICNGRPGLNTIKASPIVLCDNPTFVNETTEMVPGPRGSLAHMVRDGKQPIGVLRINQLEIQLEKEYNLASNGNITSRVQSDVSENVDQRRKEKGFMSLILPMVRTYRELSSELRIEQKLIIIQIDERSRGSVVEIIERNRAQSFSLKIDLVGVSWAVQAMQQLGSSFRGGSFFSKYRSSSAVFWLQKYTNDKGAFVKMSKWEGGIKKGNIIIPAGYHGRGWVQFATMLRKVIGSDAGAKFKGMEGRTDFMEEKLSKNTKESFMDRKTGANRGRRCVELFTANELNSLKGDLERAVVCTRYDFSSSWIQIEKNLSKYLKMNIALRPFQLNRAPFWASNIEATNFLGEMGLRFFDKGVAVNLEKWSDEMHVKPEVIVSYGGWIAVCDLPFSLWNDQVFQIMGDKCGGLVEVDRRTIALDNLFEARLKVRGFDSGFMPAFMEVKVEGRSAMVRLKALSKTARRQVKEWPKVFRPVSTADPIVADMEADGSGRTRGSWVRGSLKGKGGEGSGGRVGDVVEEGGRSTVGGIKMILNGPQKGHVGPTKILGLSDSRHMGQEGCYQQPTSVCSRDGPFSKSFKVGPIRSDHLNSIQVGSMGYRRGAHILEEEFRAEIQPLGADVRPDLIEDEGRILGVGEVQRQLLSGSKGGVEGEGDDYLQRDSRDRLTQEEIQLGLAHRVDVTVEGEQRLVAEGDEWVDERVEADIEAELLSQKVDEGCFEPNEVLQALNTYGSGSEESSENESGSGCEEENQGESDLAFINLFSEKDNVEEDETEKGIIKEDEIQEISETLNHVSDSVYHGSTKLSPQRGHVVIPDSSSLGDGMGVSQCLALKCSVSGRVDRGVNPDTSGAKRDVPANNPVSYNANTSAGQVNDVQEGVSVIHSHRSGCIFSSMRDCEAETERWLMELSKYASCPIEENEVPHFKHLLQVMGLSLVSSNGKGDGSGVDNSATNKESEEISVSLLISIQIWWSYVRQLREEEQQ
ncbi:Pentatricopeptide repeat-containing protein [Camellia lanceoleosa]|uniref:Pentatricopeptide repeat-containing protein n=1 Tax=Camellia lanceoleosa TaxID=1840588 RepID=A0ACC0HGU8_9ERIC|nr:Pentatricopeptide repeat-containing protein [Camellia lanceoleosa]